MRVPPVVDLAAVFVGGLLGSGARLALDLVLPHRGNEFPLSTLLINVAGSFLLGLLVARVWSPTLPSWVMAGLGAGVLGSFTTFSALALALVTLTESGRTGTAALYLLASVLLGLLAAGAGLATRPLPTAAGDDT